MIELGIRACLRSKARCPADGAARTVGRAGSRPCASVAQPPISRAGHDLALSVRGHRGPADKAADPQISIRCLMHTEKARFSAPRIFRTSGVPFGAIGHGKLLRVRDHHRGTNIISSEHDPIARPLSASEDVLASHPYGIRHTRRHEIRHAEADQYSPCGLGSVGITGLLPPHFHGRGQVREPYASRSAINVRRTDEPNTTPHRDLPSLGLRRGAEKCWWTAPLHSRDCQGPGQHEPL